MVIQPGKCRAFKAFQFDPEVCDTCGELASGHPRADEPDGLTVALWKVLLEIGGCWSYYGGHFQGPERGMGWSTTMAQIQDHMKECKIDWKRTDRPSMDNVLSEFAGTEHGSDGITGKLSGELYCKCGEVSGEDIGVNDLTLGQLIWRVTRADDAQ